MRQGSLAGVSGGSRSPVRLQEAGHADARVFVSSQNWSTDGTLYNRAAGLIIDQPDAATYFQQFFFYDLDNLSQQ